jgi:hypothetical protein
LSSQRDRSSVGVHSCIAGRADVGRPERETYAADVFITQRNISTVVGTISVIAI